jgi:hypothetical protein
MPQATAHRDTIKRNGEQVSHPMAAATLIYGGTIVCLNASGLAVRGAVSTTLKAVGVAETTVDNSAGAASALNVPIEKDGWYRFNNSAAGDQIVLADVGNDCFIVDDNTVAKTNGTSTRSVAGVVRDVDTQGVWISFK